MNKSILITLVVLNILIPTLLNGQSKINYLEFPLNSVSVAPANIFFDGNGNISYYKKLLKREESKLKYFRIGTDFFGTFKSGEEKGRKNYSLYTGIEQLKKLDNFSLILGYEIALNYYSDDRRHVEPGVNSIFFPQAVSTNNSNPNIERGTFFLGSLIGFIGIKYHLTKHFSIGLESGVGIGHFWSTDSLNNGEKEITTGIINDIDPNRQFVIEYYF